MNQFFGPVQKSKNLFYFFPCSVPLEWNRAESNVSVCMHVFKRWGSSRWTIIQIWCPLQQFNVCGIEGEVSLQSLLRSSQAMVCWSLPAAAWESQWCTTSHNPSVSDVVSAAWDQPWGVFPPQKPVSPTNQGFSSPETSLLNIYQHSTGKSCCRAEIGRRRPLPVGVWPKLGMVFVFSVIGRNTLDHYHQTLNGFGN